MVYIFCLPRISQFNRNWYKRDIMIYGCENKNAGIIIIKMNYTKNTAMDKYPITSENVKLNYSY